MMIVYWETSQKPLIIRTVWVGGYRHAILTDDERLRGIAESKTKHKINPAEQSNEDIAITANNIKKSPRLRRRTNAYTMEKSKCNDASPVLIKPKTIEQNPLSERVLQWLDLAGHDTLTIDLDKARLMKIRHSIPEVKINKSDMLYRELIFKNNLDLNSVDIDCENTKSNNRNLFKNLRRKVSVYAKLARCNVNKKYPTDAKNLYDSDSESKTQSDCDDLSTSQSDASEFKDNKYGYKKENPIFENEYIHIIKKQILETSCNPQSVRKKLHIFIPSFPKKPNASLKQDEESQISKSN